jgi:putative endonuclease
MGAPVRRAVRISKALFGLPLVHFEAFGDMDSAISREKQLKRWHRQWKFNLIEEKNPRWDDLAVGLGFERLPDKPRP